jgi:hypothetical protein
MPSYDKNLLASAAKDQLQVGYYYYFRIYENKNADGWFTAWL